MSKKHIVPNRMETLAPGAFVCISYHYKFMISKKPRIKISPQQNSIDLNQYSEVIIALSIFNIFSLNNKNYEAYARLYSRLDKSGRFFLFSVVIEDF